MLFFTLSFYSQEGPPWDFNGSTEGFAASNYSQIVGSGTDADGNTVECGIGVAGSPEDCAIDPNQTYLTYRIIGESANPNFKNENANIDTSAGNYIAITMQNLTGNTRLQVIANSGTNLFTNYDQLSANDADFVTHYINMSSNNHWNGTLNNINFRFKEAAGVNAVLAGDVLIDHIEVVDAMPATPRIDYTFDSTDDAEGFIGGNGVTLSQPVAGELHLEISDAQLYPKLEQSGVYSVDANTYKYIQVTLVNNSPKNKLTFVSPNGGNQFSTSDIAANSGDAQTVEVDLSELTNWSDTQSSWWFQLVDNPGDGAVASAGSMDIQQILFTEESTQASTVDVTFTVNTANVIGGVGEGGMYLGGGIFGGANAHAMQDDDGDGTWEVTVTVDEGTEGAYVFVNSPVDGGDYSGKEDLSGQDCAYGEWNDRYFGPVNEDTTLQHCYGSCESDGTCPAPPTTTQVTFNVNMNAYGLADGQTVHVNGEFTGWCGSCGNEATDPDGDGIYSITMELEHGSYFWKYTVDAWNDQEGFSSEVEGCTANNNGNFDRQIVVEGETMEVTYCWNSCAESGCDALQIQGIGDLDIPSNAGKFVHLYAAVDIPDLSIFGLGSANNGGGTDGEEWTFPEGLSAVAGEHILLYRDLATMEAYMDASNLFNQLYEAPAGSSSPVSSNGNDALELFKNGVVVETFGEATYEGGSGNYDHPWAFNDSWAFKVDGVWTYGGPNCSDDEWDNGPISACASSCPYPFAFCDNSAEVVDFLVNAGNWRVQAEAEGHMGVGPGDAFNAAWWNAAPWDKVGTGLYDDGWTFDAEGFMTHDTGEDGAIFGKKDAIDAAWPDNTPYAADNDDAEYENYLLEDYTDSYTVNTAGDYNTITLGSNGTVGFHTATAGQEYQILETGEGYMYLRNLGFDGNSWYGKFTNAEYLSTSDNEILDMRIYPNPVNGNYVTILTPVEGLKDVEVYSVTGRKLLDTTINNNTLDVSSLNSGFYMIKVTIEGQSKVSKLIVR